MREKFDFVAIEAAKSEGFGEDSTDAEVARGAEGLDGPRHGRRRHQLLRVAS